MTLERHDEMTLSTLAARPGLAAASTEAIDGLRRARLFARRQRPADHSASRSQPHDMKGPRVGETRFRLPQVLAAASALPNAGARRARGIHHG